MLEIKNKKTLTEGYDFSIDIMAIYTKARKHGRCLRRMTSGTSINRMFMWNTIRKKDLKNSKTSAKKYLHLFAKHEKKVA